MVGSLDVADGEQIDISANLTKGSVRVEIVRSSDSQGIDGIPEMDGAAIISADLVRTDGASGTVPAGTYLLRAACLEKATGTIQIDVTPVEISGPEGSQVPIGENETTEPPEPESEPGRQNGERFDDVIILEGMEETVHYEHLRNDVLGIEMDYDYENFVRHSEADREIFVSCWDDPDNPENYLEVKYSPLDAENAAAAVSETLSKDYEISRDDSFPLERAGSCILILAEEVKGGRFIASRNPDVTYFNHGENWFVQSGYNKNGEEIFYSKESITDKGLKTFWITYPTARREIGDSIAAEFEKNCRF